MGQIKTRCSAAAGLFLILLTVIAGFSSCKSNQKDIIPSAEYAFSSSNFQYSFWYRRLE